MKQVMIDIETLGTTPGSIILSLGAVTFDLDDALPDWAFYTEIAQDSCRFAGLVSDPATVAWWNEQSEEAYALVKRTDEGLSTLSIAGALARFSVWYAAEGESAPIWSNGPGFDTAILAAAYRAINRPIPWSFRDERCMRTVKSLRPNAASQVEFPPGDIKHDALHDARHQAKVVRAILRSIPQE